jgi:hypothetical protein
VNYQSARLKQSMDDPCGGTTMLQLVKKHIDRDVFQPEDVRILVAAFDAAWQYVQSSGDQLSDYQTEEARNLIAKSIIEAACQGERDERRLAELVLRDYGKCKNQM